MNSISTPDAEVSKAEDQLLTNRRTGVYTHTLLHRLLHPSTIAIVGASPREGSFGQRMLANLHGYQGTVFLVNAKYSEINGQRCYPSLAALPVSPDCVAITTPRETVESIVLEAVSVGAGGVLIHASGYAETHDPDQIAAQQRLQDIAHEHGLPILGPNCLGFANYSVQARVTFADYPASTDPRPASIGIASQSGALSQSLAQAIERGVAVSHVFSAGNQCDVDIADLVAYLAEDQACRAIVCVFEGMAEPQRLLEAAAIAWRNNKPLLVHKIATGEQGAQAALSHTGSLAGSDAAYRAAFERAGMIIIDDMEALMEAAAFFAKASAPVATGVAVCATSGGAAIMAADKAEQYGVSLPQPLDATRLVLDAHIPDFGSANNPCDVTAQVLNNPVSLSACGEALASDNQYGAIILPQPVAFETHVPRINQFGTLAAKHNKIICNVLLSDWLQGPATLQAEAHPHVALFRSMGRCFMTLAAWHRHHARRLAEATSTPVTRCTPIDALATTTKLLATSEHSTLTEREAKYVLTEYGVPVVGEELVHTASEAVQAANRLGFPVVLKVESPDLPHKTEADVIRLELHTAGDVKQAFDAVMENAHKVRPEPRITGVLVQPMVPAGLELMVGARTDPQIGPLIVVGLGGIFVELMKDTQVALAPVSHAQARAMLLQLRGASALSGFRGSEPVDLNVLSDVVVRVSEFAADHADHITEVDVNPLICAGSRIVAVDALIVKQSQSVQDTNQEDD